MAKEKKPASASGSAKAASGKAASTKKMDNQRANQARYAPRARTTEESRKNRKERFLGWQETPIQQASFGGTTKGGRNNSKFVLKHSTGAVKEVTKSWYLLDASEAPVGRLASVAAAILMGKHRATFTPGAGSGDGVIVINADKAFFTSDKADKKIYYWHTKFMGGLKMETARDALIKHPEKVIWDAVQGMLPHNKLSRYQLALLKIFRTADHTQKSQKPSAVSLKNAKGHLKNIKSNEAA